ncbi:uncharacterized protein LOC132696791 [Cylas formicarius]|uniref:uncharacterized protein LOC132696791 n=1 Tax=Cylas formicarius TaxID=197179 RepID=UPI00295848BB|nr:uncharacterized protein LOC132696791 [Cylas formicarius]
MISLLTLIDNMKPVFLVSAVICAIYFEDVAAKGLPSYLKLCNRNDPNLSKCINENVEIIRPKLKQGIPELFIPSLDPLLISRATLDSGNAFKATFTNIELFYADKFHLHNFDMDLEKYKVDIKIGFPTLRIKSIYNINGRLLVLNLNGKGPADGNYTNVQAHLNLKGTPFNKNNKNFVKWEREKIDITIEKSHLFFDKIFGDNEQLNDQTNRVINENIDTIIEELQPVIQGVVSDFVFGVVNRLFSRYSINDLFPIS